MSIEVFSARSIRLTRQGERGERVFYENGVLTIMGRNIPVLNRFDLGIRLAQIKCNEDFIERILDGLFGVIATETPVTK